MVEFQTYFVMTERRITRRDFLKLLVVGSGALLTGDAARITVDPVFKVDFEGQDELTFETAAGLAERFDKALDRLPTPDFDNTLRGLKEYANEIIPQFEYEGIIYRSKWPEIIGFKLFDNNGINANHVLGVSNCSNEAYVNARMGMYTSVWRKTEELFTLIHELAHVQQGEKLCEEKDTMLVENSAQIGAMEVAAGLANQGNPQYFYAAVNELRRMAIRSAEYLAGKENRIDDFMKLENKLSPGAIAQARFEKDERFWNAQGWEKDRVYMTYGLIPLEMIINAIRNHAMVIDNLAFPPKPVHRGSHSYYDDDYSFKLDDTAYMIEHLEEMSAGFTKIM